MLKLDNYYFGFLTNFIKSLQHFQKAIPSSFANQKHRFSSLRTGCFEDDVISPDMGHLDNFAYFSCNCSSLKNQLRFTVLAYIILPYFLIIFSHIINKSITYHMLFIKHLKNSKMDCLCKTGNGNGGFFRSWQNNLIYTRKLWQIYKI